VTLFTDVGPVPLYNSQSLKASCFTSKTKPFVKQRIKMCERGQESRSGKLKPCHTQKDTELSAVLSESTQTENKSTPFLPQSRISPLELLEHSQNEKIKKEFD
jgi:hypothetical protein